MNKLQKKEMVFMKRIISIAIASALLFSLAGCGGTPSPVPTSSTPNFSDSSSAQGTSSVTSSSNDSSSYGDTPDASQTPPETSDNNGISGMKAFPIRAVLESAPFCIPMTDDVPAPTEAADIFSFSCTSSGSGSKGVTYDYSITMDSDGEIVGASFGITSTTATQKELLTAADLFFYAISIINYDTSDKDTLTAWFQESLPSASDTATEITIGDAKYELYGIQEGMYWVDISKAVV